MTLTAAGRGGGGGRGGRWANPLRGVMVLRRPSSVHLGRSRDPHPSHPPPTLLLAHCSQAAAGSRGGVTSPPAHWFSAGAGPTANVWRGEGGGAPLLSNRPPAGGGGGPQTALCASFAVVRLGRLRDKRVWGRARGLSFSFCFSLFLFCCRPVPVATHKYSTVPPPSPRVLPAQLGRVGGTDDVDAARAGGGGASILRVRGRRRWGVVFLSLVNGGRAGSAAVGKTRYARALYAHRG